jgi:hypothetical protein
MNMRVTSPNRWKTGRMSALTVFGSRPVRVTVGRRRGGGRFRFGALIV